MGKQPGLYWADVHCFSGFGMVRRATYSILPAVPLISDLELSSKAHAGGVSVTLRCPAWDTLGANDAEAAKR